MDVNLITQLLKNQNTTQVVSNTLEDVEKRRDSKIIIIKHQKQSNILGNVFSSSDSLDNEDALTFIKTLRNVPNDKTLEIILHTPGGSLTAASVIVNAILNHQGIVRVYIPQYAMSAGLIIALAADEIYLDHNAYMGPADPQIALGYSASTILHYTEKYESKDSWVTDLVCFARITSQKAMNWTENLIKQIYKHKNIELTEELIYFLFSGQEHCHERPLFFKDLSTLIPFINEGVPYELYNLL
jgi:ATP-dependent protease ClpP protease subunit